MTPVVDFEEVHTIGYEKYAIYGAAEPFALAVKVGLKSSLMAAVDFTNTITNRIVPFFTAGSRLI
jgi:hypothetical protein